MANFNMTLCSNLEVEVCVDFGGITPNTGDVYSIQDEVGNIICAIVTDTEPTTPSYTVVLPYDTCEECSPQTVNQEYTLCVVNCNGDLVELTLPHPVWTNNYGVAVTQLNAVTLGGPDGLNN
jgi:hypothetical protein